MSKLYTERHEFAHQKGKGFPFTCGCGKHVLNLTAHHRLSQPELDKIADGLWYPRETKAEALRSLGLAPGKAADGTGVWE